MKKCPWCAGTGEAANWPSEAAKYVHLVEHLMTPDKNVLDLGSGGWPCVPHAIQVELTTEKFKTYTSYEDRPPIQWKGDALDLPFRDGVVDVVFSSHLIEDIPAEKTAAVLREWARVLKICGHMIVLHPDRDIWNYCIKYRGQPCNCAHRREMLAGELGEVGRSIGLEIIEDRNTHLWEFDYGLITVFRVLS